ncbi:transposase [Nostoc sphaeroides CCNUC1]|uniref:Transposase n=1 Tax=Nostoc sphaeroides CCNUC1 TaxID=2653204 RepID=A0A5P8VWW8_9NOSO|nr:transposase (IS4 family) protein [Nostoc sphaeroides CCNUC1]QFS50574.1 transposase protein [Nostoc sphaeroides CCNUC1]QFS50955.1 transposase (IS4 family) protein [Nostoc sphaeroides CCNUC1]QFS51372.1 transposase (IS4 family) protein [Nostoc sphaeroides CCNUC1]QFS51736.1 transposase [Nostoc sphaeroides CCNUC1]
MSLVNFEVQQPYITPSQLLLAMDKVIPSQTITNAIISTSTLEQRQRILPTHVVVVLVIAMSFWSSDSIVSVFKNLIHGFASLRIPELIRFKTPTSSSITEARQRTGASVMTRLFEMVAKPLATVLTPDAFLGGLRIMAVDGTVMDVPETQENARVFGYPGSRPGTHPAFPKARLVFLVEAGTHLITDAFISPYRIGERKGALKLLRSVSDGMLLMWDRGLHSFKMVNAKVHLNGRKTPIRSKNPREVVQEIYGWLLGHYCIRCLMFQSAEKVGLSPLRLSFTGTLRVVRRAIPVFQIAIEMFPDINVFFSWLISEIKDLKIPPPQHRSNPRVVKKTRSKFQSKKRCHRNNGTPRQLLSFQIFRKASLFTSIWAIP